MYCVDLCTGVHCLIALRCVALRCGVLPGLVLLCVVALCCVLCVACCCVVCCMLYVVCCVLCVVCCVVCCVLYYALFVVSYSIRLPNLSSNLWLGSCRNHFYSIEFPIAGGSPPPLVLGVWLPVFVFC